MQPGGYPLEKTVSNTARSGVSVIRISCERDSKREGLPRKASAIVGRTWQGRCSAYQHRIGNARTLQFIYNAQIK